MNLSVVLTGWRHCHQKAADLTFGENFNLANAPRTRFKYLPRNLMLGKGIGTRQRWGDLSPGRRFQTVLTTCQTG